LPGFSNKDAYNVLKIAKPCKLIPALRQRSWTLWAHFPFYRAESAASLTNRGVMKMTSSRFLCSSAC
jgi:hypothetical protein